MIPDPALDQWLTIRHTTLINALAEVLDLDAGLADVTLTAYYNALTTDLDYLLDLDAGLRDIQPGLVQPTPVTPDQAPVIAPLTDYARHIATRPAYERLTTRTWFPQHEFSALQIISTAIDDFRGLALTSTFERTHIRALEFASELEHALEGPLGSARWDAIVATLGNAHRSALDFAAALVDKRDPPFVLVRKLDSDLERVRDNIVAHARNRLPTIDNNDLAFNLADILTRADTLTSQDLNIALPQLEYALTDVTGADLIYANLTGIPLDGVRWSPDTRWPPHLREHITRNSQLIGPDLYQINPGSMGTDTFVNQSL